jgi:serine protease Do
MKIVGSPASRRQFLSTAGCLLAASTTRFVLAQDASTQPSTQPAADPRQVVVKLFGAGVGSLDSYGTGILVSPQGHVLTIANHLVSTGFLTAVTADGRRWPVETVATSTEHDAAIVRIQARPEDVFPFLDLQQAVDAEPGTPVLAWSNMFRVAAGNEPVSVVHGVIAASVPLEASQGRWKFPVKTPVWILDAITNNSGAGGGLVVDESGRAVGMIGREIRHARRITPSSTAAEAAPLISDRELTARFGLTMLPAVVDRTPAWVDAVTPNSPAARAGIRRGDLILLIGDAVITSVTDVRRQMTSAVPGRELSVTVNRENELTALKLAVPPARK